MDRGPVTADGCAVVVYRQLQAHGEPELVASVTPPGGSVLDLGCGVGRVSDPLVARGFSVVGVDNSPDMLACVSAAEPVLGDIETLRLGREFDTVLLGSHLANIPEAETRQALFATARAHVRAGGAVVVEWHPPEWFDGLAAGEVRHGELDGVATTLTVHACAGEVVAATAAYSFGGGTWEQPFTARRLPVEALERELGLGPLRPLTGDGRWLVGR